MSDLAVVGLACDFQDPLPISWRTLTVCPPGSVMSPGCWPGLHAPTCLPSMIDVDSFAPFNGGSNVARASVWYDVLPASVITACDCIFVMPRSQLAIVVTLLPATLISCFVHIPAIIPVDTLYISRCTESSRHIVVRRGGASRLPVVMFTSQSPGLSFGNSCAAVVNATASSAIPAATRIDATMGTAFIRPSGRRIRGRRSPRGASRRGRHRGSLAAASRESAVRGWS